MGPEIAIFTVVGPVSGVHSGVAPITDKNKTLIFKFKCSIDGQIKRMSMGFRVYSVGQGGALDVVELTSRTVKGEGSSFINTGITYERATFICGCR